MITFGRFLAFMRLWVECIVVRPATIAFVALTFSIYAVKPLFPECDPPDSAVRMLAAVCIGVLSFVNCYEVKWETFIQDIFTYAKLLALFIIIGTGIVQLGRGKTENFTWEDTETDITKIALSFYSGLFAYNGWNYLNFVIEEMKDPVRDLPRAIMISCITVTIVYVTTNIAFYTTLNVPEVLGSEAVAVTFAGRLYGQFAFLIPVAVALSTFGGVNGILLTSSRLFYAGACERQIKVNLIFPIIYVLCSIFVTLVPMIASPVETGIGCAIIFTGVPVYFIIVSDDYVKKPEYIRRLLGSVTAAAQKVLLVLPKDD